MNEGELGRKVREVQERYGHLLTTEAALSVIRAEEGGPFEARVLRIFRPHEFERGGRKGRVCRAELERIGSGERPVLVLWDEDAERLANGGISAGDLVLVSGAYEKEGELHIGRRGSVKVLEKAGPAEREEAGREAGSERLGVLRGLSASGETLEALVELDGRQERLRLEGAQALSLLGIRQAHEGISLEALVELKRSRLLGRTVRL